MAQAKLEIEYATDRGGWFGEIECVIGMMGGRTIVRGASLAEVVSNAMTYLRSRSFAEERIAPVPPPAPKVEHKVEHKVEPVPAPTGKLPTPAAKK